MFAEAAIGDPAFAGDHQRFYLSLVAEHFPEDQLTRAFVDRAAKVQGAAPYARRVLEARCHVAEAWAARTGKVASKVTEAGWQGFESHLQAAAKLLTEAHELAPGLPEAPADMLRVLGGLGAAQDVLRAWLDRATAAQFDYAPAYATFLWFAMPRWGGSHAIMLDLGRECVASGRFDTGVPAMFRQAVSEIAADYGNNPGRLFAQRAIQKTLQEMHDGYMRVLQEHDARRRESSLHVVELALGKRASEAAALYQGIDGGFDAAALSWFGVEEAWLTAQLQPHLVAVVPKTVAALEVFADYATAPAAAEPARQAIDVAADRPTRRSSQQASADWIGRVAVAAYDQHGHRDPKWNEAAKAAIDAHGRFLFEPGDTAAISAYRDRLQTVLEAGCDDPLLRYVLGCVHENLGEGQAAFEQIEASVRALPARRYPDLWRFLAERRLEAMLRNRDDAATADQLAAERPARIVAMAADACFRGADARFFVTTVVPEMDIGWKIAGLDEDSVKAIADHAVDPWLRHTVLGLFHSQAAARGGVICLPEGRQRYFDHVRAAVTNLEAAHALHPEFPEPAAAMITVRMLEPEDSSPRVWFERAVSAEVDCGVAYRNYRWALRPEYGGSVGALYRFGVECLETRRFDTDIPKQFVEAVTMAAALLDSPRQAWASPDCVRRFEVLVAGYEAASPSADVTRFLRSGRALTAWAGGRYEAAAAAWRAADRKLDPLWLQRLNVTAEAVAADLGTVAVR